jgi:hypothetical protein
MRGLFAIAVALCGCNFDPVPAPVTGGSDAAGTSDGASVLSDAPIGATCPSRYTEKYNGHSYFATGFQSWTGAKAECATDGGHLIKIETTEENQELAARVDVFPTFVWIGLSAPPNSATYTWLDGAVPVFQAFDTQPNAGSDDCVLEDTVDGDGHWTTHACSDAGFLAICECDSSG